jgi:hypothetical protein
MLFENEKERQQALAVIGCCLIACAHRISAPLKSPIQAPPHLSPARSEVDIGDAAECLEERMLIEVELQVFQLRFLLRQGVLAFVARSFFFYLLFIDII